MGEELHPGEADSPHLAANGIVLDRRRVRILDHVTVGFRRSKVTAVVGPSGAGKTTLLRCLNRLEEATTGTVLLDGTDIRELDPRHLRQRVGMVFQTPVLFEGDVRTNLIYGLDGDDEDHLRGALDAVHLSTGLLDRDTAGLSVGEAQRVTLARALMRDPEVLLLDEPTSALDRDATSCIEHLVRDLTERRGLTVVLVTHDLAQAQRVADVAVLLASGRLALVGTPAEVQAGWREAVR